MKNEVPSTPQKHKKLTLPYIGRFFKKEGFNVRRDKESIFIDLGQEPGFRIGLEKNVFSISFALPMHDGNTGDIMFLADTTMAVTNMTKIFLTPNGDSADLVFSTESICATRQAFESIINRTLSSLMDTVKTYFEIRKEAESAARQEAISKFMMAHCRQRQMPPN